MRRKIILSVSVVLIIVEVGFSTAVFTSGERQIAASLARVAALVRELSRPIPKFNTPQQIYRPFWFIESVPTRQFRAYLSYSLAIPSSPNLHR